MNDMIEMNENNDALLTATDATAALTLIDAGVRALGVKIIDMPGGFAALDVVCQKLVRLQQSNQN